MVAELPMSAVHRIRLALDRHRSWAISKAAEAHARTLEGESRRDALLLAMHFASGRDRARLLAEAARISTAPSTRDSF